MSRRNKKLKPKKSELPEKKPFGYWIRSFVDFSAGVITLLVAIPVGVDYYKTPREKFYEEKFIEGDLNPGRLGVSDTLAYYDENFLVNTDIKVNKSKSYKIIGPKIEGILIPNLNKSSILYFGAASNYAGFSLTDLEKGVDIFSRYVVGCMPPTSKLMLGMKNGRLYVSVEFKDIQNEQTIGVLHYNHWKLYRDNTFDFRNNDTELEVIDKQNNIVFAIKYIGGNKVQLSGYFISPTSVFVMRNISGEIPQCVFKDDPYWKSKAEILIAGIVSAAGK